MAVSVQQVVSKCIKKTIQDNVKAVCFLITGAKCNNVAVRRLEYPKVTQMTDIWLNILVQPDVRDLFLCAIFKHEIVEFE